MVTQKSDSHYTLTASLAGGTSPDPELTPLENTAFDFCDVLAAGLRRPTGGTPPYGNAFGNALGNRERYIYDAPVVQGHAPPNANIVLREDLYQYLDLKTR